MRERAPHAVVHTDAVQAPQWLDLRAARRRRRPGRDLGPQVRRSQGRRRARRARRRRSCRSSKVAGTSATCAPARRTSPASSRFATALRITDDRRAEEWRASRALRDRLERGLARTVPGLRGQRRSPRRESPASCTAAFPVSRPRRCSSRSISKASTPRRVRRAVPARSTRRTCCSRWACRASGRCRRSASVSATRRPTPTSTKRSRSFPKSSRSCARA